MSLREVTIKLAPNEEYFFKIKGNFLAIRQATNALQVRDASNHLGDFFTINQGEKAIFGKYFENLALKNIGAVDDEIILIIGIDAAMESRAAVVIEPIVYDVDAQLYFDANTGLNDAQKAAANQLVLDFKSAGIWALLYTAWAFVGGNAIAHKWNIKNPADLDSAFRLSFAGGLTHSLTGVLPDGATGWADTFFNPVALAASPSDLSMGFYSAGAFAFGSPTKIGMGNASGTADNQLNLGKVSAGAYMGGGVGLGVGQPYSGQSTEKSEGFFTVCANGSRDVNLYVNGVQKGVITTNNGALQNCNVSLFAMNSMGSNGYFWNKEIRFAFIARGLSALQNSQMYAAVQAFQTALGRQV